MEQKRDGEHNPSAPPRWKKGRAAAEGPQAEAQGGLQGAGAAASSGMGAEGPADPSPEQRSQLAVRREELIAQAKFDGVEVPPELVQMGADAVEAWAKELLL